MHNRTCKGGGDIAAANALARAGDTIEFAAGTHFLTSQIEIKDGVTLMNVTNRTQTGSIANDPLLDTNYAPGAGSPAIDAGVDPATVGVTVTADYNGVPRPQGATFDVGAHEFGAAAPGN